MELAAAAHPVEQGLCAAEPAQPELPADAWLSLTLVDVTHGDLGAPVLAEQVVQPIGSRSIRFALTYDSTRVAPGSSFMLQANLMAPDQQVIFTATYFGAIGASQTHDVQLELKP